ncbi:lysophospholipase L1-like esterase [Geodermatophilus tzadiensis]|uniref:Lysophospholipase L1-like esterase n=1 Tax=Geodermatophilus tzadiensis TaxID=1137988 RepID=A0A2T0U1V4_9ACTN|nr:SGNH/GDSL hydrolase family protein [Geodermatophilus tzadiensis]PRY51902.1 lysophospholipase L1-like esterase [Geodermatophilus tzadiensis]
MTRRHGRAGRGRARGVRPASPLVLVLALALALVAGCTATGPVGAPGGASPSAGGGTDAPAPPPPGSRVLFFGDSYTAGYGASSEEAAFPALTAADFGWDADVRAGPGTGFVAGGGVGQVYLERLGTVDPPRPDLVVLQGGLNDARLVQDTAVERTAALRFLAELDRRFPGVPVVLLGPPLVPSIPDVAVRRVDRALAEAAAQAGVRYVSPAQEGWDVASRLTADDLHPDDDGHAYLAARLAAALRASGG